MKDKIAQLMKMEGLSTSRLAEILEIQPSAVSHLVSGRNNPRFDLVKRILCKFPKLNPDWLLLDSDVMYRDGDAPADRGSELSLFDEEELHVSNNATSEGLESRFEAKSESHIAVKQRVGSGNSAKPQPVRLIILYDDGSFENFSLRE